MCSRFHLQTTPAIRHKDQPNKIRSAIRANQRILSLPNPADLNHWHKYSSPLHLLDNSATFWAILGEVTSASPTKTASTPTTSNSLK